MTKKDAGSNLLYVNEAAAAVKRRSSDDLAAEQFVMRAVTLVVTAGLRGDKPEEPFDMIYFVDRMFELYEQREALKRILAGEDLRWWDDV